MKSNCLVVFLIISQNPKICSNGKWLFNFPLLASTFLFLTDICFIDESPLQGSVPLFLSKYKSQFLHVNTLMIVSSKSVSWAGGGGVEDPHELRYDKASQLKLRAEKGIPA